MANHVSDEGITEYMETCRIQASFWFIWLYRDSCPSVCLSWVCDNVEYHRGSSLSRDINLMARNGRKKKCQLAPTKAKGRLLMGSGMWPPLLNKSPSPSIPNSIKLDTKVLTQDFEGSSKFELQGLSCAWFLCSGTQSMNILKPLSPVWMLCCTHAGMRKCSK